MHFRVSLTLKTYFLTLKKRDQKTFIWRLGLVFQRILWAACVTPNSAKGCRRDIQAVARVWFDKAAGLAKFPHNYDYSYSLQML